MKKLNLIIKETNELSPKELVNIMQERVKVFVVEQNCPYQEVDKMDETATHVLLQEQGKLVAYARIIPHVDQVHISFGRVLVVKEYRKHKLGRKIVQAALDQIQKQFPNKEVKIQAQSYLQNFYSSFGFKAVSDVYLEDNIPHLDMVLEKQNTDLK